MPQQLSFYRRAGLPPSLTLCALQGAPVSVVVTLRGKKYDVNGATSVADVQKSVEEQAGLAQEQQVCNY